MKWILFTGTWHLCTEEVAKDVREQALKVLNEGNGIVTGGATGVDYVAMMEAMKFDPNGKRLQICLPTNIDNYILDYHTNWIKDLVTHEVVEELKLCIEDLNGSSPENIHTLPYDNEITQDHYDMRHNVEVELSDEVYVFHVNNSHGTGDTVEKAKEAGLPITFYKQYQIKI